MNEAARAWERVYGTPYDLSNMACIHFTNGYNAARGRA